MSWSKEVTLWCDHDGCSRFTQVARKRVDNAREIARRDRRWYAPDGGPDYCPKHHPNRTGSDT